MGDGVGGLPLPGLGEQLALGLGLGAGFGPPPAGAGPQPLVGAPKPPPWEKYDPGGAGKSKLAPRLRCRNVHSHVAPGALSPNI